MSLRALGVGPGDEVVVTPRSFVASAACVIACGATPVFADVDRDSQNITAASVERVLTARTRAIIAVHLAGWPCDMDALMALARPRGLLLIEDCAQAHGATWRGRPVGGFGAAAAFSFCTDKHISTGGEGGMLVLRDDAARRRAWSYKDHGKAHDLHHLPPDGPGFRWLHATFGTNWRLTEMQAALGLRQLAKLPNRLSRRRDNARWLGDRLTTLPALRLTEPPPDVAHAYYRYYAFVRPERLKPGWDRQRLLKAMVGRGVPCATGACPEIYREQSFRRAGLGPPDRLPTARELGETSLAFPVDTTLDRAAIETLADAVGRVMTAATA